MTWVAFIIGCVVGGLFTAMVIGLCICARDEREMERRCPEKVEGRK